MNRRQAFWNHVWGAIWVLPAASMFLALVAGAALSAVEIRPGTMLGHLVFQGTADDARALLTGIAGTMITVIALVLGLTVVALQLSSTQFSPRLLRNFLHDRPNIVVLSVFVATFTYSTAGLYTVGVSSGSRTASFPRLAVSGALVLMFASLAMLVFFSHHLAYSIQIDSIMRVAERNTLGVIRTGLPMGDQAGPRPPEWAMLVPATQSGYMQAAYPETLLPLARSRAVSICFTPRVGEHIVAGTVLAHVWGAAPGDPTPDPSTIGPQIANAIHIGFERTLEQDAAFGIRQLVDVASKALSPAVNDPYTAVQAIDHLSVILCALVVQPLGDDVARDGGVSVTVPGRTFAEYLTLTCGQIRRYGASEPTVPEALLGLLGECAMLAPAASERLAAIDEQLRLIVADAEREVTQPADLAPVHAAAESVRLLLPTSLPLRTR